MKAISRYLRAGILLATLLVLAGCATYPGGGGYPSSYPGGSYAQQIVGTVQDVDPNGRLMLSEDSSGYGGRSIEVYFDQRTPLHYQGRTHPVAGLERGDRIRVETDSSGGRLYARSIELIQNVRDSGYGSGGYGSGGYGSGGYGSGSTGDLRGTIAYVDTRTRLIELDRPGYGGGYEGRVRVRYDDRTLVEYGGRTYRPEDLDRGDGVRIQARQAGSEWWADRIWVEYNAGGR
jgi:hypothetical protein